MDKTEHIFPLTTMDFELRAAKAKWEKEQKEKKEKARKRLEQERKAREEAAKRQEAIEAAQRIRRIEETAAAIAVRFRILHSMTDRSKKAF